MRGQRAVVRVGRHGFVDGHVVELEVEGMAGLVDGLVVELEGRKGVGHHGLLHLRGLWLMLGLSGEVHVEQPVVVAHSREWVVKR